MKAKPKYRGIAALLILATSTGNCGPRQHPRSRLRQRPAPRADKQQPRLDLQHVQRSVAKEIGDPKTDSRLARAGVWFLFRSGAPTELLLPGLKGHPKVRELVVVALGERADAVATRALFEQLAEAHNPGKATPRHQGSDYWLAWALGQLRGAANLRLVRLLASNRTRTRAIAARALGWSGSVKATPKLVALLNSDGVPQVRAAAAWALAEMKANPVGVASFRNEKDKSVRVELARWLARVPSTTFARSIIAWVSKASGDEAPHLLDAVVRMLPRLPPKAAAELLVRVVFRMPTTIAAVYLKTFNRKHLAHLKRAIWRESGASCEVPNRELSKLILRIEGYPAVAWLKKVAARVMRIFGRRPNDCVPYTKPVTRAIGDWAEKHYTQKGVPAILAEAWCEGTPIHWWRRDAAQAFAERGKSFIPVLLQLLKRCSEYYPDAAARALVKLGARQHATAILRSARRPANESLLSIAAKFGGSTVRASLVRLLRSKRVELAGEAARALGRMGDRSELQAIRKLEARLRIVHCRHRSRKADSDAARDCRMRRTLALNGVIEALGRLGSRADIPLVKRHRKTHKLTVTLALVRLGDPETRKRLPTLIQEAEGFEGVRLSLRTLSQLLRHPNAKVRQAALEHALYDGPSMPTKDLLQLSQGMDPKAVERILWALVDRGTKLAKQGLLGYLGRRKPRLVYAAAYGLASLGDRDGLDAVVARLGSAPPTIGARLAGVLCRLPNSKRSRLVPKLVAMLGHPETRARAQQVLGCWKHRLGRPALLRALHSKDKTERRQALRLLEQQSPAAPLRTLARLLGDPDISVRRLARRQLGTRGTAAIPVVRRLLRHGSPTQRAEALQLAYGLDNKQLVSATLPLANRGPTRIRILAMGALGRILDAHPIPLRLAKELTSQHPRRLRPLARLMNGVLDERLTDRWFPLLVGGDAKLAKIARHNLSAWPQRPTAKFLRTVVDRPVPGVAFYIGRWGTYRAEGDLWRLFERNTRRTDIDCTWWLDPDNAASVISGLSALGARRLLRGYRIQRFAGCAHLTQHFEPRRLKRTIGSLREVSGRTFVPFRFPRR